MSHVESTDADLNMQFVECIVIVQHSQILHYKSHNSKLNNVLKICFFFFLHLNNIVLQVSYWRKEIRSYQILRVRIRLHTTHPTQIAEFSCQMRSENIIALLNCSQWICEQRCRPIESTLFSIGYTSTPIIRMKCCLFFLINIDSQNDFQMTSSNTSYLMFKRVFDRDPA